MDPETIAEILAHIRRLWKLAADAEITMEANPGSAEAQRFAAYHGEGVNRLSLGVQALNDHDLRRLGRRHSADEARAAFDIARQIFTHTSFDLIYARQYQSLADWQRELKSAISMGADHLSLYQLSIEAGTAFADRRARGLLYGLPDENLAADLYQCTAEICEAAGLTNYEVSNYARSGAEGRHNLIYWRYGDYIGIGPGAHGRLTLGGKRYAVASVRQPEAWLQAVAQGCGELSRKTLSASEQADEMMLMGLRLREGVDVARWERVARRSLSAQSCARLQDMGMIRQEEGRLYATAQGRLVLNALLVELMKQ